jgi:hypothetical protein
MSTEAVASGDAGAGSGPTRTTFKSREYQGGSGRNDDPERSAGSSWSDPFIAAAGPKVVCTARLSGVSAPAVLQGPDSCVDRCESELWGPEREYDDVTRCM